ncbi:MAG TPA: Holliday junction branch migration protein RuvA [Thermoflexia bacterium]|nr:Holliday junction branch migration protein RuvA [Thermoflexia bacterium]
MIAQLTGEILSVTAEQLVLSVGGVGFEIGVADASAYHVGEEVSLHTYLHVRENTLALYGFADAEAKSLFEMLLSVNRIGPKAALSILGTLSPETLRQAISNRQPAVLARAPGVGRKTGEAIILQLKDRLAKLGAPISAAITTDDADVIAALTALGFSLVEAQGALQQVPRDTEISIEEKIRLSLAQLR